MDKPIGFDSLYQALCENLPPVVLFTGPEGIGKSLLARSLAAHHSKNTPLFCPDGLSAEQARELIQSISRKRVGGPIFILINLDGVTTHTGNILLKTLEEPPKHVRFILWASEPVLPTIEDRATTYPCPPLTTEQVRQVLQERLGWAPVRAEMGAAIGNGSVALSLSRMLKEPDRQFVVNFLRVIGERDSERLPDYIGKVTPTHMEITAIWAEESLTGVWIWFRPGDVPMVKASIQTLAVLASPARPRLKAWAVTKTLTGV